MFAVSKWIVGAVAATAVFVCLAQAQESPNRKELKRGDLSGTAMEVVLSTTEYKPGDSIPRHIHHGEEAFYWLQGGTVETPDGKQVQVPDGASGINVRDVPHAGIKVVGDKTMKLLTVHIVDKGKPLYDAPPK
jgi:quercetin dioxygenase-like cupin family protein